MNLESLEQSLKDLTKQFHALKTELATEKAQVQLMPLTIKGVFPGDVWVYPNNKGRKWGYFCTVQSVNKRKNHVYFVDGGWNPLDNMLSSEWVLVSRRLTKKIQAKAEKL